MLALALRFFDLGKESYWYDELIMVRVAQEDVATILQDGRPPVYVLLAHYWIELFGTSEAATRSLSALAGVASVPLLFLVGRRLFGPSVGLISALLMTVSQFQIYHSQDFRYYSLFAFMAILSYYCLILAVEKKRSLDFAAYSVVTILLFYTHTFGLFLILAQNLYFLGSWRRLRPLRIAWMVSQGVILVAIGRGLKVAWMMAVEGQGGPGVWLAQPSVWSPISTSLRSLGLVGVTSDTVSGLELPSWTTVIVGVIFAIAVTVVFAVKVGLRDWRTSIRDLSAFASHSEVEKGSVLMVLLWFSVPVLVPLVLSSFLGPMYHHRYMIGAAPALYLLVAYAFQRLAKVVPLVATLGLLVILATPGLYDFYREPFREQWREAAAYVAEGSQASDVIVFAESGLNQNQKNFDWYYKGSLVECGVNRYSNPADVENAAAGCLAESSRLWLVVRAGAKPDPAFRAYFFQDQGKRFRLIESRDFTNLKVYLLEVV